MNPAADKALNHKVFLISGGTSGIGKAIARGLARQGAKIVIISRSKERGAEALRSIAKETGNNSGEYVVADLSLQSSIREASAAFKWKYENLQGLVNAGGAVYWDREATREGIERSSAVNYLSHFLLTHELLDLLKDSSPSRVITVSGNPRFLNKPKIDFDDIQMTKQFSGMKATGQAMFARTLFAFELAKRIEGTGVSSYAFHPGWVKSNLTRNSPWYVKALSPIMNARAKKDCDIGVHLASAQELEAANGAFFDDKGMILPIADKFAPESGRRLWRISEDLIRH